MKKDRLVFLCLCAIFVVSLLFRIFYFIHLKSMQMNVQEWMNSREDMLHNLFRLSSLADVCIKVVFIFAIVRMFRNVFPAGMFGRQWCWGIVLLFVSSMIIPVFLGLSFLDVVPVSWSYILSNLNIAATLGGPVLLVLLFFRLFKCEKILYRRLFLVSIFLLFVTIIIPWMKWQVVSLFEGWVSSFWGMDVITFGGRAAIALVELLFIWEVNRLQDSDDLRERV